MAACRVCSPVHGVVAAILLNLGRHDEARTVVEHALALPAGCGDAYDALAFALLQLGEHQSANELYRRSVERAPNDARLIYNLASSERSLGRLSAAEAACDLAIANDPLHFQSYLLRSELRVQTVANNHVDEMERLLASPGCDDRALMFLGYAIGKELDDLGQYERAFGWFSRAAMARRLRLKYDVAIDVAKISRVIETCPMAQPTIESLCQPSRTFVFVFGLPRSGTTLAERILMRLPGVRSNGETENFSRALLSAVAATDRDVFARCAEADPRQVADRYRALARPGDAIRLIEKLPLNYLYLGAIRRALPGASAIVLTRSPMDSCFAMYRTLFGAAYPFSYDFQELALYYAAYARLLRHWQNLFGDWVVRVRYEDLVEKPVRTGTAMARACGLPWSDDAINIEKNVSVSTTASASQVRRPIYQSSVDRWRKYESHLGPLATELRSAGVTDLDSDF